MRYINILKATTKQDFLMALELSDTEKSAFKAKLDGNVYELSSMRRNYLILRLDSIVAASGADYDIKTLTIEHVLPQTVDPNSQWAAWWPDPVIREQWIHRIANLVPLPRRRNSSAQNYDFDVKKKKYFSGTKDVSPYALTTQVLKEDVWDSHLLNIRQQTLIDSFINEWKL